MDKRTILAVAISVVIITVGFGIQNWLSPSAAKNAQNTASPTASVAPSPSQEAPRASMAPIINNKVLAPGQAGLADPGLPTDAIVPIKDDSIDPAPYTYDNGTFRVIFDPKGAGIVSLKLVEKKSNGIYQYLDGKEPVEMIMPGTDQGLLTRFGGKNSPSISTAFKRASSSDKNTIEFYREFCINNAPTKTFRLTKKYTFFPKEFLFQLDVGLVYSANEPVPLTKDGVAYTLSLGPQIGPISTQTIKTQGYPRFVYLTSNGKQTPGVNRSAEANITESVNWVAIDGKYFSFVIIPGAADFKINLEMKDNQNQPGSQINLTRSIITSSNNVDSYRVYAGPKLANILEKYNKETDNSAGQSGRKLDQLPDGTFLPLWWLEEALKWVMSLFYLVIPNWGIAIILLTVLVKLLVYPLTKKSMVSTARMQALNPKLTELRAKYKENPQKLNAEMAELYKKEKINPLGGCLPILLQFPFFIAMYNLFNNHFDLRGAMFIPGWIPDLSVPEFVFHFAQPFIIPLVGITMTGLHILPFLYLGSQFLTTKLTQTTSPGVSTGQMKFMMYGLPLVFFFILYEVPSGLLVYWIFQNVLSIFQQQYINRHLIKLNLRQKVENPRTNAIIPKKRKTK